MNTGGLTTGRMQSIAREFNLSETTFVERARPRRSAPKACACASSPPRKSCPFAGHPTLGTASVLQSIAPETFAATP